MNLKFFRSNSIKTRVTLSTLGTFAFSIWVISFYISSTLQTDMQRILGEQQFGAASIVASQINNEVKDRFDALDTVAAKLASVIPNGEVSTQEALEDLPIFLSLFNSGSFVTRMDGTAIASFPASAGRTGVNFMDRDYINAALMEGRSSVSKPIISKTQFKPVFTMAVPIRDSTGQIIGALIGC
jgi:sensor histidine kinase regulating citrate/malate metabolism